MNITQSLSDFYDTEAQKFYDTRKRHRPEFDHIVAEIKRCFPKKKEIRILELGCGSGRLFGYLSKELPTKTIKYVGVDISQGLIRLAKKDYPDGKWVVSGMTERIGKQDQETFDVVIAVASFHHLPTINERLTCLSYIYRALSYEGVMMMTNRSLSDRFEQRFEKPIRTAKWKAIASLGWYKKNDVFLPRKSESQEKTFYRYYHLFSIQELQRLGEMTGFGTMDNFFISSAGDRTNNPNTSRNIISVRKKNVFMEE